MAQLGAPQSFASVAGLYESGNERIQPRLDLAFEWYRKSAYEEIDPDGYFGLARFYADGRHVARDLGKARLLFIEAFRLGSAEAAITLGTIYLYGRGVAKDLAIAEQHLTFAADQGYPVAYHYLASIALARWKPVSALRCWWRCVSMARRLTMADPAIHKLYRLHGAWKALPLR